MENLLSTLDITQVEFIEPIDYSYTTENFSFYVFSKCDKIKFSDSSFKKMIKARKTVLAKIPSPSTH